MPLDVIVVGYVPHLKIESDCTNIDQGRYVLLVCRIGRNSNSSRMATGIGGMAAALTLGQRGHRVVVLEATPKVSTDLLSGT